MTIETPTTRHDGRWCDSFVGSSKGDDEEDDLQSPIGFEDDAEVVAAALRRIRQLAEARTGSERPTT